MKETTNLKLKKPDSGDPVLISDLNSNADILDSAVAGKLDKSGGTLTGPLTTQDIAIEGTETFMKAYVRRFLGPLDVGTRYASLDTKYKDGTWYRLWRLRFPAGCNFWGKLRITLFGNYSKFNASGIMSKTITCNFNGGSIYNNVGFYDGLGINVENDFRISEAIWNATAGTWEILIWQEHLSGDNTPRVLVESWLAGDKYAPSFMGITIQPVELTQDTQYVAPKATVTGEAKTVQWTVKPMFENPYGFKIATIDQIPDVSGLQPKGDYLEVSAEDYVERDHTWFRNSVWASSLSSNSLSVSGSLNAGWLRTTALTDLNQAPLRYPVLDPSGWIYSRTPEEMKADLGIGGSDITVIDHW